ncbi:MAG: (2Fe-2S)-binding protein [Gammaproteobacteria bacterium]|jgi:predicted molibdopterin-dependent oxidoreductase YjgC|nr:(2Fe-2S)-binding protein [Gammaproteobacteria bacterium]MBT3724999.1 (2Fe-2S)-binding protein [Gammaproteobacteria bacterium]MBT4075062.1 (2Fe-2S)-binding protein [Gammaproteobacteria bacterium]MBT4449710.1 (2Fe-2S)-binding protein [Gammaproteobacteria bacterium]MBT6457301.1 (2Fe-2S)-binding protein [Gammaproteobacteria bacterium]
MNNKPGKPFFYWKDTPLSFIEGESIAIALTRSGIIDFGVAQNGQIKSIFCGIGQCQNCIVLVKGRGISEACLTLCQQDMHAQPISETSTCQTGVK